MLIIASVILAGCGGGGGTASSPPLTPSLLQVTRVTVEIIPPSDSILTGYDSTGTSYANLDSAVLNQAGTSSLEFDVSAKNTNIFLQKDVLSGPALPGFGRFSTLTSITKDGLSEVLTISSYQLAGVGGTFLQITSTTGTFKFTAPIPVLSGGSYNAAYNSLFGAYAASKLSTGSTVDARYYTVISRTLAAAE